MIKRVEIVWCIFKKCYSCKEKQRGKNKVGSDDIQVDISLYSQPEVQRVWSTLLPGPFSDGFSSRTSSTPGSVCSYISASRLISSTCVLGVRFLWPHTQWYSFYFLNKENEMNRISPLSPVSLSVYFHKFWYPLLYFYLPCVLELCWLFISSLCMPSQWCFIKDK